MIACQLPGVLSGTRSMTTIFISYRRDDAAAYAGRLYDGLRARYGEDHVFMDIDRIQPGENFAAVIVRSVRSADVVLAVIGEQWLTIANDSGQRRLDDPEDFVRLEMKAAFETGRRVIPVLVGGATMPAEASLPPPLKRLAGVQAVDMSDERWDYDYERLARSIDGTGKPAASRNRMWYAVAAASAAIVLGAIMFKPQTASLPARVLRATPAQLSGEQARAMVIQHNFFHARWNTAGAPAALELEQQAHGTDVVVTATRHNLMWQQGASPLPTNRDGAQRHVQELNARRFAGHDDWRLPTLEEALTLMSATPIDKCRLPQVFERSGWIMRTADTSDGAKDWIVYFCDGIASPEAADFSAQVRAVRAMRSQR